MGTPRLAAKFSTWSFGSSFPRCWPKANAIKAMSKLLLRPGEVVRDTHTIVRHLGSGAFGQVYLSRHRYMGLQALKVFVLSQDCEALEEAYLLAKLSHPNIV